MIPIMIRTLLTMLIGAACAVVVMPTRADPLSDEMPARVQALVEPAAQVQELLIRAISMVGVKYRYGGNSAQSGFDCSGFVRHVFSESIALELPRTSYAMGKLGEPVEKDDLQPGDLVFHNTLNRALSHVGIYLGEGRFVHAPSRGKSVEIVDMAESYWKKRYNGARRLIIQ
jgi:cell wall-associated NlpC family hydrolase